MPRNDDAEVARAALAFSRKHDAGAFALTYLELGAPAIRAVPGQLSKRKTDDGVAKRRKLGPAVLLR